MAFANGHINGNGLGHTEWKGAYESSQRQPQLKTYPRRPYTATNHITSTPGSPTGSTSSTQGEESPRLERPSNQTTSSNASLRSFSDGRNKMSSETSSHGSSHVLRPSEASRLRGIGGGPPVSYNNPGRHTPPTQHVENFSRPRKSSVKSSEGSPRPQLVTANTFPNPQQSERMEEGGRLGGNVNRTYSSASTVSTSNHSIAPLRTTNSIPDYTTPESVHSKQRNISNQTLFRPGRGLNDDKKVVRREPPPRSNPMYSDDEEARTSYRSAVTTNSSYVGTNGTARSSVLTRSSSVTSMTQDDGMSVDDAIGMYEAGFQDSGAEDGCASRPETSQSLDDKDHIKLPESQTESLHKQTVVSSLDSRQPPEFPSKLVRESATILTEPYRESLDVPEEEDDLTPRALQHPIVSPVYDLVSTDVPFRRKNTGRPDTGHIFDDSRDRYGFKKTSQHITKAEYDAWNGPYTEHLLRRKRKWVAMMKDAKLSVEAPTVFPPKSTKMKRFIRKGIPPTWRGAAWFHYGGGASMMSRHPGYFDNLLRRAASGQVKEHELEQIERDLHRTFPDNILFKPDRVAPPSRSSHMTMTQVETPILLSLRRVLQAFAIHAPKTGYCQSLNFLAGLLLLFIQDEEKTFWMLVVITHIYLPGTHEVSLEGANVDLGVLMTSIKESMPAIWNKIGGELDGSFDTVATSTRLPPITLCCTAWFMSCFIGTLPIETTLRVWDSFFYEGSKTIFRVALTIFKLGEVEIRAVQDPMEIFQVVQTIPRKMLDANLVIESCFKRRNGFGHLSQETIEARREVRRSLYRDERARAKGETVRGPGVERKATMFGRRRRKEAMVRDLNRRSKEI